MGICRWFCINKTGKALPIFDIDNGNKKVGELYNREAFALYGREGSLGSLMFLGPNGKYMGATTNNIDDFEPFTTCLDYPYGKVTLPDNNGTPKEYSTFIMRRTMNIYKSNGDYWGKVAANMLVATDTPTVGDEHNDWKEIKYVQHSPDRKWIRVDAEGVGYGFVDTGLSTASNYSKIPFYGSW